MSDALAACVAVIDRYIAALNQRDLDGVRATYHFPHVLIGAGRVVHYPAAADLSFAAFDSRVAADGWVRSTFDGHRVVLAGPGKLHLDVWFTRLRADDSVISTHHSLYVMTEADGRWGIQARSSYG